MNKKCIGNCDEISKNTGQKKIFNPISIFFHDIQEVNKSIETNKLTEKTKRYCPTGYYLKEKENESIKLIKKCDNNEKEPTASELQNYSEIHPIFFSPEDILNFYNIYDYYNLEKWITDNINKDTNSLIRLVNMWIMSNENNLSDISKKIFKLYRTIILHKHPKDIKNTDKHLQKFIDEWISDLDKNSDKYYRFNIFIDFKVYLKNKFSSSTQNS